MNDEGLRRLAQAVASKPWEPDPPPKPREPASDELRQLHSDLKHEWPAGNWSRSMRHAFLALCDITGKPSLAWQWMEKLEQYVDERRPPENVRYKWEWQFKQGERASSKQLARVQTQYDAFRRGDMDDTLRKANEAHRHISQTVIDDTFNKDTSGALQHLGQIIAMGTEKREQAFNPRRKSEEGAQITPTFVLMPPPERRQLAEPMIEGEVVGR